MDVERFIQELLDTEELRARITRHEILPEQEADCARMDTAEMGLLGPLLENSGWKELYRHQALSLDLARKGHHVVIATGTASGKTLCYNLPILESLIREPQARALYLFPTKALAQDQLRSLRSLLERFPPGIPRPAADTYDGDTPSHHRRRIRTEARLLLSNPDMLHQSILPAHPRWASFFRHLRFVVLDEIHVYRGIFGSHVAHVMRRLTRICRHYGAEPQFLCCSATIRNPQELAECLTEQVFSLVDRSGAARGRRHFIFWNPPPTRLNPSIRRSALSEARLLLARLLEGEIQTLAFLRTRSQAEMLYRQMRDSLKSRGEQAGSWMRVYRGGYLPSERREIERQLFQGELLAVAATNALELGIDVGCIRACLIVGYPGSFSSLWQQSGRAGRGRESSLTLFIASNDPEDQYLVRHPDYFLNNRVESAVVDPQNPYITAQHLGCAAFELPLHEEEAGRFGAFSGGIARILEEEGMLRSIDRRWYWSRPEAPASRGGLRNLQGQNFAILRLGKETEAIGTMDESQAPLLAHPGAVYLHEGDTFLVEKLDFAARLIQVKPMAVDYFTRPIVQADLREQTRKGSRPFPGGEARLAEVDVSWKVVGFRRMKFYSWDNLGVESLDMPVQKLSTVALMLRFPPPEAGSAGGQADLLRGLQGLENTLGSALPLLSMCDRGDIGCWIRTAVDGTPELCLYDRYPGGMGYAEQGLDRLDELFRFAREIISTCPCREGCPSCVGVAEPGLGMGSAATSPDKAAALELLSLALGTGEGHMRLSPAVTP